MKRQSERERERGGERGREREKERDRDRDRETERQRDRETERCSPFDDLLHLLLAIWQLLHYGITEGPMDHRTNGPTDQWTDRQTNPFYRDAIAASKN